MRAKLKTHLTAAWPTARRPHPCPVSRAQPLLPPCPITRTARTAHSDASLLLGWLVVLVVVMVACWLVAQSEASLLCRLPSD